MTKETQELVQNFAEDLTVIEEKAKSIRENAWGTAIGSEQKLAAMPYKSVIAWARFSAKLDQLQQLTTYIEKAFTKMIDELEKEQRETKR